MLEMLYSIDAINLQWKFDISQEKKNIYWKVFELHYHYLMGTYIIFGYVAVNISIIHVAP